MVSCPAEVSLGKSVLQCSLLNITLQLPCPKDREQAVHPCAINFERNLCICRSRTFVPDSWMCKKQTSVFHNPTESEIISLDAGIRVLEVASNFFDLEQSQRQSTGPNLSPAARHLRRGSVSFRRLRRDRPARRESCAWSCGAPKRLFRGTEKSMSSLSSSWEAELGCSKECDGRVCDARSMQSQDSLLSNFVCRLGCLLNIQLCRGLLVAVECAEIRWRWQSR